MDLIEKSLAKSETKRKESEVESNRIRQQLTEARQKNVQLKDELSVSKQEITRLMSLMNDLNLPSVDTLQQKLDILSKSIQEKESNYRKTVSVYRRHLMKAHQGVLDPEVVAVLEEIKSLQDDNSSKKTPQEIFD